VVSPACFRGLARATLGLVTREASEILDAALALSRAERAELAAILADSVGDGASPEQIQAAWLAEAKRRLAAYERGELEAVDYEDMMRRLRTKDRRPRPRQASLG
jgi:putative addiction module component (TIGR02574 family)